MSSKITSPKYFYRKGFALSLPKILKNAFGHPVTRHFLNVNLFLCQIYNTVAFNGCRLLKDLKCGWNKRRERYTYEINILDLKISYENNRKGIKQISKHFRIL